MKVRSSSLMIPILQRAQTTVFHDSTIHTYMITIEIIKRRRAPTAPESRDQSVHNQKTIQTKCTFSDSVSTFEEIYE